MSDLIEIRPTFSLTYQAYVRFADSIFSRDYYLLPLILPNVSHIGFRKFMTGDFFTTGDRSMAFLIVVIFLDSIVAKVFKPVIGAYAVVVAQFKSLWPWTDKCQSNKVSNHFWVINVTETNLLIPASADVEFAYSSASYRSNATQITDHIKTFVARYIHPNFLHGGIMYE